MGEGTAQTVSDIQATRDRLAANLAQLERKLPAPAALGKRLAGVALGGGAGGTALFFVARRLRRRRRSKPKHESARLISVELAPHLGTGLDAERTEHWLRTLAALGGIWLALRALEVRQLRRAVRRP